MYLLRICESFIILYLPNKVRSSCKIPCKDICGLVQGARNCQVAMLSSLLKFAKTNTIRIRVGGKVDIFQERSA